MKDVLRSTAMAFLMFSVIPMPRVEWKKGKYAVYALLPAAGRRGDRGRTVCVDAPQPGAWLRKGLYAAGLTLLPVLLSGGIHLDGFCDTADALSSHAAPERKREILKDSHTGAFAILYAAGWFTAYFALCTEIELCGRAALFLGILQVFSRALGAFASVALPGSGQTGLLAAFRDAAEKKKPRGFSAYGWRPARRDCARCRCREALRRR